jgi:hypothetical protein
MQPNVETGKLALGDGLAESLKVVEFAGISLPGDAVVLMPPSGGELAVGPDGRYAFTGSAGEFADSVSTHYSYVAEAEDGTLVSGSFSLGEHLASESLPDFQAWSMDDILALDDMLGNAAEPALSSGGGEHSAPVLLGADLGLADASGDILDHMLHGSFES